MPSESCQSAATAQTMTGVWHCLHTQPKHEHIAEAHLRLNSNNEVYLPRIRFERKYRNRKCWVTEPLFPSYVFVRFSDSGIIPHVRYIPGIHDVVHFGSQIPTIHEAVIDELRRQIGGDGIHTIDCSMDVGDSVEVVSGPFEGLQGLVSRVIPAKQRVAILLDFLGRQTLVQVSCTNVFKLAPSSGV